MTVRYYDQSQGSAPVLDGQVGSLVNLLDKCLVAGFGAETAAGWTKPYTGTNGAAFRMGAGNQYYLNVNDNAPGAGGAKEARIIGYETMSAFATGTNLFPTAAQLANGLFCRKSVAADATTRNWKLIADERTFHLFILTGDVANTYYRIGFGDIYSFKTSDIGHCLIVGRETENNGTQGQELSDQVNQVNANVSGHYLNRDAANSVGAIPCGKMLDQALFSTGTITGLVAYKNPADNLIIPSEFRINHTSGGNTVRGRIRGLWAFAHPIANASDGDTFTGTLDLAGRSFAVVKLSGAGGINVIETSNTWDT